MITHTPLVYLILQLSVIVVAGYVLRAVLNVTHWFVDAILMFGAVYLLYRFFA
jgi:hypothetical protein